MKKEALKERVTRKASCVALVLMGMTGLGAVALVASASAAVIAAPSGDGYAKSGGASATMETQIAQVGVCCAVTGVRG